MNETKTFPATLKNDADYEATVDVYLREMELLRDDMEARQQRIERTQHETRAAGTTGTVACGLNHVEQVLRARKVGFDFW